VPSASVVPIIVQFRPLIDLIQKFRLSESTIDTNYSINSVDVVINGGTMGPPQGLQFGAHMPFPQQPGQFVWVPQSSYAKPPGGNGGQGIRQPRMHKFAKASDPNSQAAGGRFASSRGGKSDKRGTFEDKSARDSQGDQSSRGDKDSSRNDRNSRADTKLSTSEGGDKKRAASLTVAAADEDDDDEDEEESSSSEEDSK
jgi:hypothetical protein